MGEALEDFCSVVGFTDSPPARLFRFVTYSVWDQNVIG